MSTSTPTMEPDLATYTTYALLPHDSPGLSDKTPLIHSGYCSSTGSLPSAQESVDPGPSNQDTLSDDGRVVPLVYEHPAGHLLGERQDQPGEKLIESKETRPKFETAYEEAVKQNPDIKLKDTNGWSDLSKTLHDSDEREGKDVSENVDTLLVFSGLFSAVIITLVVEASRLLQRDQAEATTIVLLHISQQLSSFAVAGNPTFMNSTTIPAVLPPFTPDTKSKWVNALWLAALVLSLITASLGMLVKQWFREYLTGIFVAPREHCRVRYFRRVGLLWYKVPEIAGFLPLLLQLALILFFAGLVIYIRIILPSIGWHVIALIGLWFLFFIVTTLIPIFSPSCPYKTPFLKILFLQFRKLSNSLYDKWKDIDRSDRDSFDTDHHPHKLFDEEEAELARTPYFDVDVLLNAYDSTKDMDMWEMITRCVDLNSPRDTLATFSKMVERKLGSSVMPWSNLEGCYEQTELRCLLRSITTCIHKAFQLAPSNRWIYGFGRTDADAVIILERLSRQFRWDYSSDRGIQEVARMLVQESFSIPGLGLDEDAKLRVIPSLLQDNDPSLRQWTDSLISSQNDVLVPDIGNLKHSEIEGILPDGVLEVCRVLFLCAERTPEDDPYQIRLRFPQMTRRLAKKLKSFEEPTEWQDALDTFSWQCLLDMAMRLDSRVPGIINESLFEALHTRSVKTFVLFVENPSLALEKHIQMGPVGTSRILDELAEEPDWRTTLKEGEYIGVDIRGEGRYTEYGNKWDYRRLRVDCKHRIEFLSNFCGFDILSYEPFLFE
ncbi:hypothetical protein NLI96_g7068 [Meripilus lineatus]|uniref:DUF6535 domain-containing protein n=1 Tax=Meripilus lineatus TaxID=2056292 RepID=A0AAD5UZU5_9APHY|nr:hypothetical protein NLI96_g7068 [Physisporinus lineatus]